MHDQRAIGVDDAAAAGDSHTSHDGSSGEERSVSISAMRNPVSADAVFTAHTEMPLVGRLADLGALRLALDDAVEGQGRMIFLSGESGIGKTRLVQSLAREAVGRDMLIAMGAAYSAETGIPYGMISDALVPPLRSLPPGTLAVLARGAERDLGTILHGLATTREASNLPSSADADRKARLL